MTFDSVNPSFWLDLIRPLKFPALTSDIETEAVIIGGGMTGILTQFLLSKEGIRTVLIEAKELMHGASGFTTAKLTSQHGLIYDRLLQRFGIEKARYYYKANEAGIKTVREIVRDNNIQCDWEILPSYVFTDRDESIGNMEKEVNAMSRIRINGGYTENLRLPFPVKYAITFNNQAQFHPVKFMNELLKLISINGGKVYENTRVSDLTEGSPNILKAGEYSIRAKYVVIATHFPFYDGLGMYFTRLYAERSYILGLECAETIPEGIYISAEDPVLSLRTALKADGSRLLLVGGENHKTGDRKSTMQRYGRLEKRAREFLTIKSIPYRWSAQDYNTPDGVPFIGRLTSDTGRIFTATGYAKWGMAHSAAAAMMIRDLIKDTVNPWQKLYKPSRISVSMPAAGTFIKENINIAGQLLKSKTKKSDEAEETLISGKSRIVTEGLVKYGEYMDSEGIVHRVQNSCTHLKCGLAWNDAEKTWDCPCHGSRFDYTGRVIECPARINLTETEDK